MPTEPWEATSQSTLHKLSTLGEVLGHLDALCRLEPEALSHPERQELASLVVRVKRQLEKLKQGEFHIAVVGLEKAGKSTFLNAWLGSDLLPNRQERCTYATTELRSTHEHDTHTITIDYLGRVSFEKELKSYEARANLATPEGRAAAADLAEIVKFKATIEGYLDRPTEERSFGCLEDMRPTLWNFVANPSMARALRAVTLRSPRLYQRSGIVFHDVPGYDSPLSMHRELARQELARADAIIFVTNLAANTSLTQAQLDMLGVADDEDPDIQARDKLFVFLNKIDATSGKADLNSRTEKATRDWCDGQPRCRPERVVPGSAGAYLMRAGTLLQPDTCDMLESSRRRLEELAPPLGDGVEHLRGQVEHYLDHERGGLLVRRCDVLVRRGRELAQRALENLQARYPASPAELALTERVDQDLAVQGWLEQQWGRFQNDFAAFWNSTVMPSESDDAPQRLHPDFDRVREVYSTALSPLKDKLQEPRLQQTLHQIHAFIRSDYSNPVEANVKLRHNLSELHIAPDLEGVTAQMTTTIMALVDRISERVQQTFFGLEGVRQHALPEGAVAYQAHLAHGLAALFLRQARPCIPLMLRHPRGKAFRQRMMEVYRPEALALQSFYENAEHPERANLPRFLLEGSAVPAALKAAVATAGTAVATAYAGPASPLVKPAVASLEEYLLQQTPSAPAIADTIEAVRGEIVEDCQVFIDYLDNAVYRAAGFEDHCKGELLRVRRHLIGEHSELARNAIFRELRLAIGRSDPRLPAEIHSLSDTSLRRHIVEAISRLRISLDPLASSSLFLEQVAMMTTEPTDIVAPIHEARLRCEKIFAQLDALLTALPEGAPDEQRQRLQRVQGEIRKAIDELTTPTLNVAFVGTTNAGKSTTVNGFIGRRLAPMENDEMSAGLLTIRHAPAWSLQVERGHLVGQGAATEPAIYDSLNRTMRAIIDARRARTDAGQGDQPTPQPIFRVCGPLLPAHENHVFAKSTGGGLGLAIHDLPGLRTTDDPENFQVIREQIKRSFCVVIVDRNSLFEREKRDKLLGELEDVVAALGGSPALTLFLLNKIDTRNFEDKPISEQVEDASGDISRKLKLQQPAEVIPFSSLLMYHGSQLIQAALEQRFQDAQAMRSKLIFDCQQYLHQYLKATLPAEQWLEAKKRLRQIEDDADEGRNSPVQDLVQLGFQMIAAAGNDRLWGSIRERLARNGVQLLVFPVLHNRHRQLRGLIRDLRGYAQTQLLDTQSALDNAIAQINKTELLVQERLREHRQGLQKKIEHLLQLTKEAGSKQTNLTNRDNLLRSLGIGPRHRELFGIRETLEELVKDLETIILDPLTSVLKRNEPSATLRGRLERISPDHAEKIRIAYEELRASGYCNYAEKGYKTTDPKEVNWLKNTRKPLFGLFLATRGLLTYRAERFLRTRGVKIAAQVQDVTHNLADEIWKDVQATLAKEIQGMLFSLPELSHFDIPLAEQPTLPEEIINIKEPDLESTETIRTTVERLKKKKSCAKDIYETVEETSTITHVNLPSASDIHEQMRQGIQAGRDQFWIVFFEWFKKQFENALEKLKEEFSTFSGFLREGIESQKKQLREDASRKKFHWQGFLREVDFLEKMTVDLAEKIGKKIEDQHEVSA